MFENNTFATPRLLFATESRLRSVSKQFANVPQQSCIGDRKFCKTFEEVSMLNAAPNNRPRCAEWEQISHSCLPRRAAIRNFSTPFRKVRPLCGPYVGEFSVDICEIFFIYIVYLNVEYFVKTNIGTLWVENSSLHFANNTAARVWFSAAGCHKRRNRWPVMWEALPSNYVHLFTNFQCEQLVLVPTRRLAGRRQS